MSRLLGIDLDNTIIDYTIAYTQIAQEFGLPPNVRDRKAIRRLFESASNDDEWQRFQSVLYTRGLTMAVPSEGVLAFLDHALEMDWAVTIISHKTELTQKRFGGLPLRSAATAWLIAHEIVPSRCKLDQVNYEETQQAKIERIGHLGCDVFIDDLDTIVFHHDRPLCTQMVHYAPESTWLHDSRPGVAGRGDFAAIGSWLSGC